MATLACGCSREVTSRKPAGQKPAAIGSRPVEVTLKQRSTAAALGSDIRLTIDDITRGQVMVSLADSKGGVVLAATSLKEDESSPFTLNDEEYHITLRKLDNELIGDDFATFVISRGAISSHTAPSETKAPPPSAPVNQPGSKELPKIRTASEREKIEQLLSSIEADSSVVFIRNDAEHSATEAAEHLRAKWSAAGDINSADEFIEKIASKSSLSGEPYRVCLPDGTVVSAGDYLRGKLRELEQP
jgi:hypothetical protein